MTETGQPLRADARRNREKIMVSAAELFARLGTGAQMDQIAEHCGLGLGTLYRHFPTKEALLSAIISRRFEDLAGLARAAEQIEDPGEALETLLRSYLESAEGDAAFQLALLGSAGGQRDGGQRDGAAEQKSEFRAIASRIIDRAIAAGTVRADLTVTDFPVITCGIMAVMYYQPGGSEADWRRHFDLVLDGIRATHH